MDYHYYFADHKTQNTRFFCKQHFYKQSQIEISKKIKQMLLNDPRLNFATSKLFTFFIYVIIQKDIIGHILKIS